MIVDGIKLWDLVVVIPDSIYGTDKHDAYVKEKHPEIEPRMAVMEVSETTWKTTENTSLKASM
jgi:hypothetical protein